MAAPPVPSCPTGLTRRPDAVFQQHHEQPRLPAPWRHLQDSSRDSLLRQHLSTPTRSRGAGRRGVVGKPNPLRPRPRSSLRLEQPSHWETKRGREGSALPGPGRWLISLKSDFPKSDCPKPGPVPLPANKLRGPAGTRNSPAQRCPHGGERLLHPPWGHHSEA